MNLNLKCFLISQNISAALKGPKVKYKLHYGRCTLFLGMPHGTTPAAVTTNKNIIMISFKSSGDIHKKEGGSDSCFGEQLERNLIISHVVNKFEIYVASSQIAKIISLSKIQVENCFYFMAKMYIFNRN